MAKINFDYIRNKLGILFFKLKKKTETSTRGGGGAGAPRQHAKMS